MSSKGYRTRGIECASCKKKIPLSLGAGAMTPKEIEALPDPFEATCLHCGDTRDYPRGGIGMIASV
jgi:ribosomal protein S27E